MASRRQIRLPKQWPEHVKSGILHAISLASVALTIARSRATSRRRLQAEVEQANAEIALLREELYIKDGRWERSRSRRRPHYARSRRDFDDRVSAHYGMALRTPAGACRLPTACVVRRPAPWPRGYRSSFVELVHDVRSNGRCG